jgi:1-pyrroline-4-hydroxy-2-carboxylate deaminase
MPGASPSSWTAARTRTSWSAATTGRSRACAPAPPAGSQAWSDVVPAQCVRLWELCTSGDLAAARELYADLLPLAHLDITPKLVQYFKAALDELGLGGGPCRPPRLPLTDVELVQVRQAVDRASRARGSRHLA